MTMLDTITALATSPVGYGVGGGTLLALATPLARAIPGVLRRVLDVWATARDRREETRLERARTERAEVEHEVQVTTITAEMLARYEARLTAAEQRAERAERRVDACEERHREAERRHAKALAERDRRIAALERAVRRLGDTPTGMQAVDGREKT